MDRHTKEMNKDAMQRDKADLGISEENSDAESEIYFNEAKEFE